MAYMLVKATVDDFDAWKSSYDDLTPLREEHGVLNHHVFRSTGDPREVLVLQEYDSEESARSWTEYLETEEELTEPLMSDVEISYYESVERRSTETPVA